MPLPPLIESPQPRQSQADRSQHQQHRDTARANPVHPRLRHSTRHASTAPATIFRPTAAPDSDARSCARHDVFTVTCIVASLPCPVIVTFTGIGRAGAPRRRARAA